MGNYTRLKTYASKNGFPCEQWKRLECDCGGDRFLLYSDELEGAAYATCVICDASIDIFDSCDYLVDEEQNICSCLQEPLHVIVGQSMYKGTNDPSWSYVGAVCPTCGLEGVYVDWKER